jgi:hypothetical protein
VDTPQPRSGRMSGAWKLSGERPPVLDVWGTWRPFHGGSRTASGTLSDILGYCFTDSSTERIPPLQRRQKLQATLNLNLKISELPLPHSHRSGTLVGLYRLSYVLCHFPCLHKSMHWVISEPISKPEHLYSLDKISIKIIGIHLWCYFANEGF